MDPDPVVFLNADPDADSDLHPSFSQPLVCRCFSLIFRHKLINNGLWMLTSSTAFSYQAEETGEEDSSVSELVRPAGHRFYPPRGDPAAILFSPEGRELVPPAVKINQ